jgi:outer membrane receptor protein involved in Fe transport
MTGSVAVFLTQILLGSGAPALVPPVPQGPVAGAVAPVTGVVRDAAGGVVRGAQVMIRVPSGAERQTVTDAEGRFTVAPPVGGDVIVIVRAAGFADWRRTLTAAASREVDVVLQAAGISETVSVTPTRTEQELGSVPASVSVLDRTDIRNAPAISADDVLRQLPTFSLFRRSNSISAHPTSQGVSLRGIAPSGVSRTLVLLDGIPYNDAFGGWVYWTGLPLEGADRIEVVDGASSSLYGTFAMGGVINIRTSPPAPRTLEFRTQYGNRSSPKLDFRGTDVWGKVGIAVNGSLFDTDGYPNVVEVNKAGVAERGPIDNNVNVNFRNFSVKLDYDPTERVHAFVRTGYFREERDNGKISTFEPFTEEANDTTWKYTSGGVRVRMADSSELQATLFTDIKTFRANFMAVPLAPVRTVGRFSLNQESPSKAVGGMVQWSRAFGTMHVVTAGTDVRWVDGDSVEDVLDTVTGTTITRHRVSGGTQRNVGAFVQDLISVTSDLTVTLSARVDRWRNYDAHNLEHDVPSNVPTVNNNPSLPASDDTVVSPRVGALYRVTDRISVWGDAATGFRAPTLNELYRRFSFGTTLTLPNAELGPERLKGGELGVTVLPLRNLTWRTTWFDNRVKDPVANLTITPNVPGFTTTLRRENLGRTRIWGVQTDVQYRIGTSWKVAGAYLYNDAKVKEAPQNPGLANNCQGVADKPCTLQQVPKHRGSIEVAYANPRLVNVAVFVQGTGRQFDDDLNLRVVPGYTEPGLPKYGVIGLSASREVTRNVEVFLTGQNLLDQEFYVGTQPTLLGPPRLVSAGVRVRVQGR